MRKLDIYLDALKFLSGLDAKQYKQVASKTLSLMLNATPADPRPLKGYALHRVDIGEYRIIYEFDTDTVIIVLIGKRNDDEIYGKLKRLA